MFSGEFGQNGDQLGVSSRLSDVCVPVVDQCFSSIEDRESDCEEAVHVCRVTTKRLRAAWGLTRPLQGKKFVRNRQKSLRRLSGFLSGSRDQTVLKNLASELSGKDSDAPFLKVSEFLEAETGAGDHHWPEVTDILRCEKEAWESLQFQDSRTELRALRNAQRRFKRKALRVTCDAVKSLDPEIWHDWRKALKKLRYQREFLGKIHHRQPGRFDLGISRLGSLLGQRNDLANLVDFTVQMRFEGALTKRECSRMRRTIVAVEMPLMKQCRKLGKRLFLRSRR